MTPLAKSVIELPTEPTYTDTPVTLGDRAERSWVFQTFVHLLVANGPLIFNKGKQTVDEQLIELVQRAILDTRLILIVKDELKSPEEVVLDEVSFINFKLVRK